MSVLDQRIDETAFAVLDIETTGLRPGYDRIVEICVVRLDPGEAPAIALDTLVDPHRPVTASEVHGIRPTDVEGAPSFAELAGEVLRALAGRVVVGHNVSFDRHFLKHELGGLGVDLDGPFLDTSALRPLLGDGPRASLSDACAAYGLARAGAHVAANDAVDTARLLRVLLNRACQMGIRSFRELHRRGEHACLSSLSRSPLPPVAAEALPACPRRHPRRHATANQPLRAYYDALILAIADGHVSAEELEALTRLREHLDLPDEDVFTLHAQAFAGALLGGLADGKVSGHERAYLASLAGCLRHLGWCPGQP